MLLDLNWNCKIVITTEVLLSKHPVKAHFICDTAINLLKPAGYSNKLNILTNVRSAHTVFMYLSKSKQRIVPLYIKN
jgi:hypothetical protein